MEQENHPHSHLNGILGDLNGQITLNNKDFSKKISQKLENL